MGYNGVSVYFDWALLEGKRGDYTAEGIFALEPFFEAAQTAGIYILARPGPYINAEVSGGGFPGWLQRNPATLRTRDQAYLDATSNYVTSISKTIAKFQITQGGPVVLLQPENEYTSAAEGFEPFPDPVYFKYVEDQYRNASIVVPLISNDASPQGYFAPGPPRQPAAVDIYGHDGYPLGFDCANPEVWPDAALPTNWRDLHLNQSSSTPYSIIEFQGGSFDPWGGPGFAKCLQLVNAEFERVFYKNDYSFGVTIFNIYMTYGGTNWGNLGHPGGYTSYDYGAVIKEDRGVDREKYSQAKLQANFLQASPAYLTAIPQNNSNANGSYTGNHALATTALLGNTTNFFVIRHAAYNTLESTTYRFTLPTSRGNITVPQLGGSLSLHGRDSKMFVNDYDIGGVNLLYSTAEIFTWKKYGNAKVLVVYGGPDEINELAIDNCGSPKIREGQGVKTHEKDGATIIQYFSSAERKVVELSNDVVIYLLDRNSAYNYWVVDLPSDSVTQNYTNPEQFTSAAIVKAGYLLRAVESKGNSLRLVGDLNTTTSIEIIGGAPQALQQLTFNGKELKFKQDHNGVVTATATYQKPKVSVPNLSTVGWKVLDSLPEIQSSYDDSAWTAADHTYTNNTVRNLTTPTSLYASDYGYNTGNLLFRGHFTATGKESSLYLSTQGGSAFGHSLWLNDHFVASFYGGDKYSNWNHTYSLPAATTAGKKYVITVLLDNMGLDENYDVGDDEMKNPRGILDFSLNGHDKKDVQWKLTGNLGGEDYRDRTRGPLNEGGLYAERQGYHLPGAPTMGSEWKTSDKGPMEGIPAAGVSFYATTFDLSLPKGYDIPLAFTFRNSSTNTSATTPSYRCQIYVNGYQFGKYVYNIGPQDTFPVPEGIFNYQGSNYVAVSLWSLEKEGAKVDSLQLVAGTPIQSGYGPVEPAPQTGWEKRDGAY